MTRYADIDNTCSVCGQAIDIDDRNTHQWVSDWQKNRMSGEGIMPLKLSEPTVRYAHGMCLDIKKRGLQESLLG